MASRFSLRRPSVASAVAAVVLSAVIVGTMGRYLAPSDKVPTAIGAIWVTSIVVALVGGWAAIRDVRRLTREWDALQALDTHRYADAAVTLSEAARGAQAAKSAARATNEPLALERVRFVERLGGPGAAPPPSGFRAGLRDRAVVRTAGIGGLTRFLSTVLLLLSVVGTFAGIKAALPTLVDAMRQTASSGAPSVVPEAGLGAAPVSPPGTARRVTATRVTQPGAQAPAPPSVGDALESVSDAFGSNFLALFGALALGVFAYGATTERRHFLTALEAVAERRWYPDADLKATSVSALDSAIGKVGESVAVIAKIGPALDRLNASLDGFQGKLVEAIREANSAWGEGLRQESVRLQTQLNTSVKELVQNVGTTAAALERTADAYAGLVTGLEERDLGVQRAADALAAHSVRMDAATGRVAHATDEIVATQAKLLLVSTDAHEMLARSAARVDTAAERVGQAIDGQRSGIDQIVHGIGALGAAQAPIRDELVAVRGAIADAQLGAERATSELAARAELTATALGTSLGARLDGQVAALGLAHSELRGLTEAARAAAAERMLLRETTRAADEAMHGAIHAAGAASAQAVAAALAELRASVEQGLVASTAELRAEVSRVAATIDASLGGRLDAQSLTLTETVAALRGLADSSRAASAERALLTETTRAAGEALHAAVRASEAASTQATAAGLAELRGGIERAADQSRQARRDETTEIVRAMRGTESAVAEHASIARAAGAEIVRGTADVRHIHELLTEANREHRSHRETSVVTTKGVQQGVALVRDEIAALRSALLAAARNGALHGRAAGAAET